MTLLMNTYARADEVNLDKRCFSIDERNILARIMVEGDQCKRDLSACELTVQDVAKPESDITPILVAGIFGVLVGGLAMSFKK